MRQRWVWPQLIVGWLPFWALYSIMIVSAHSGSSFHSALFAGFRAITCAALLSLAVARLTKRYPWPHPIRPGFVALHLVAASAFAILWFSLTTALDLLFRWHFSLGSGIAVLPPIVPFLVLGVWLYVMVAGVQYATQAAARASDAESQAVRAKLEALRSQLNPHFLFNALHTVVQLIPLDPKRAMLAAELLAGLLRTSLEEERDLVPLDGEQRFVSRYLDLERMRFGNRLQVTVEIDDAAQHGLVPAFSLQTLVENAVRHGASPRIDATTLEIRAMRHEQTLTIDVRDNGAGVDTQTVFAGKGTGLVRLRDRMRTLFGDRGTLTLESAPGAGFRATLVLPFVAPPRTN